MMEERQMGKIIAVCISEKKGTAKKAVAAARCVERQGVEGDAHAGNGHRQVSLLAEEKIEAFRARGVEVGPGAFGENLVVSGIDFACLPLGTRFSSGEVLLELSQIGKECHQHCAIFRQVGDCIMPREGVFATVTRGGVLAPGMEMRVLDADGGGGG